MLREEENYTAAVEEIDEVHRDQRRNASLAHAGFRLPIYR